MSIAPNRKDLDRLLVTRLLDILATVAHIGKLHATERYPDTDEEDEDLFATNDPVVGDKKLITNTCEVGLPEVREHEYTSDADTQLVFTYPITYTLGVTDRWDSPDFPYESSSLMLMGIFFDAGKAIKDAGRSMGLGQSVCHYYLQGGTPGTRHNDTGEASEHVHDWSLTIRVTGIKI